MALTWTAVAAPSPPSGLNLSSVCWAPALNLWWACGTGPGAGTTTNLLYKSSDGITWTNVDPGFQKGYVGVAWSSDLGQLCLLSSLSFTGGTSTHVITTSPDGVVWTERDIPDGAGPTFANNSQFRSLCWAGGTVQKWVAVAQVVTNAHQVITSPDGVTWTNQVAAAARTWNSVAYSPDLALLVATGATNTSSSNVMTSADGVTWTSQSTPVNAKFTTRHGLSWGNGLFTVFGDVNNGSTSADRAHLFTSPDGTTWTAQSDAGMLLNHGWQNAVWAAHARIWVAVANSASPSPDFGRTATSPDGITWTQVTDVPGAIAFAWAHVAVSPDLRQIVAVSSSTQFMYAAEPASDGITPTTGHLGGGYTLTLTCAGGGFTANTQVYIDADLPSNASGSVTIPGTFTPAADWIYPGMGTLVKAATNVVCVNANTITCTAPIGISHTASALSRACGVVAFDPLTGPGVPNISCWLANGFTYLNPTITSVTANSGTSVGGNTVTITGTNLYARGNGVSGAALGNDIYFSDNRSDEDTVVVVNATTITCVVPGNTSLTQPVDVSFRGIVFDPIAFALGSNPYVGDANTTSTLVAAYTYTAVTYTLDWSNAYTLDANGGVVAGDGPFSDPTDVPFTLFLSSLVVPDAFNLSFSFMWQRRFFAVGTRIPWIVTSAPTDTGWWLSVDENFTGAASAIYASRPKDPRSYREIVSFATGSAAPHGGFPGPSCVFQNKLLYAAGGYTVGSTSPTIRSYDGLFDREVVRVLRVGTTESRTVVTMLAANGTVYFSTLDAGSNSTDWSGRVFSLDLESGAVTQIGATFPAGHVPYALAWHAGRLWCGTHRQSSAAAGKVYFFRPSIDTAWTADYDLATASMANVTSLLSYKGHLFVGTTAAAATFAKVLVRSELGVYTTSTTATGGSATANNGFLALAEFGGSLYASFWNADTPKVSKIYAFDNTTWMTAYSGASSTLVPFVGFPQDTGVLLAIGGSVGYAGTLLSTANGTVWADRTAFLTQFSPTSTGLPVFGVIGH